MNGSRPPPRLPPVIGQRPPPLPAQNRPPPIPPKAAPASTLVTAVRKRLQVPSARPSILTPEELERFKNLMVFARMVVEGFFAGKHQSPHRGSAAEFAEYKEYSAGDDVSNLDWRVYGRTRRLFLRQYEAETDMVIYLLVDTSGSMGYAGKGRQSKYLLGAKVAAALAYLMIHQGDKASLALFADRVTAYHPPGSTRRHLHNLVADLEQVKPASTTFLAGATEECANLFRKRGLVVILSDFFTDYPSFFDALAQFMHRRFEILLLQVLDPDELNLPSVNVARFVDLETNEELRAEPEEIQAEYRRTMKAKMEELAHQCDRRQIKHAVVRTDRPYLDALEAYLAVRGVRSYSNA